MSDIVNSSLKSAVKGTAIVFFGMAGGILLWFAAKVVIVRNTTVEEFGIYVLVSTTVMMVSIIATLGLPDGITRYASIFLGEGRKEAADSISLSSLQIGMASGVVAFLALFFSSGLVAGLVFYKPVLETPFKAMALFIPFYVMSYVLGGILRGHGIIRPKIYYLDLGQPLSFLIFLGVVFILRLPFIWVIYAYVMAMAAVLISIGSYCYKRIGVKPFSLRKGRHGWELLRFSFPINISSMGALLLTWADTMMLGRYTGAEVVGLYNVSISLARFLTAPLMAVGFVFMPLAGDMYGKGQSGELNRTYQVLTKWVFSITLPIFFAFFFFPEMVLSFLFGERFVGASASLRILSAGFMLHVMMGTNTILLLVLGLPKHLMYVSIFGALLNVALNYILIKQMGYGIIGASVATGIALFAINVAVTIILYRANRTHPFTSSYIKPVIGSGVAGLVVYGIAKILPVYLWMLPVYLLLFFGGYVVSLLLTGSLDREDIFLFEEISTKTGLRMHFLRRLLNRFAGDRKGQKPE